MDFELKWLSHQIVKEWLLRMFSLSTVITFIAFMKMYKWLVLGPAVFAREWSAKQISSYHVLEYLWQSELRPLLLLLPVAALVDILIKKLVIE